MQGAAARVNTRLLLFFLARVWYTLADLKEKERRAMDYAAESLKLHYQWRGKLDTVPKMEVKDRQKINIIQLL